MTNGFLIMMKLAGGGDHLPLREDEQKDWAKANDQIGKLSKSKGMKELKKSVEKYAPLVSYVTVAGMLFGPRAMLTWELLKEKRAARARAAQVAP